MKQMLIIGSALLLMGSANAVAPKKQTVCPVMGGKINTNLFVVAEGKRVYVCCSGCLPDLKKEPAKYIKQLEAQGVKLEAAPPAPAKQ
jgi:YHS domain-containing protein